MLVRDFAGELAVAGRRAAAEAWKQRRQYHDPETALAIGRLVFADQCRKQIASVNAPDGMEDLILSSALQGYDLCAKRLREGKGP